MIYLYLQIIFSYNVFNALLIESWEKKIVNGATPHARQLWKPLFFFFTSSSSFT